jgi:flagellar biosynthesis/type III secretory pathway M-ring protein FliF/YscJ
MSLSVLVGQPAHWEGSGKSRHRVVAPPPPETMKTIRDLVAGVTGFNADRGDQLIVESLPFESGIMGDSMLSAPLSAPKPDTQPAWLVTIGRYRDVVFMAVGGLLLLSILLKLIVRYMPNRGFKATTERVGDELEAAALLRQVSAQQSAAAAATGGKEQAAVPAESPQLLTQANAEFADRVRQFAQKEPAVSANVLRMWLHDQKA